MSLTPCVLCVAPNGARRGKTDHPQLPVTAAETARAAAAARDAGAAMLHLHVRDREGAHTLDAELYKAAIVEARREAGADLLIQITTEAVGRFTPAEQMAAVEAVAPEAASMAVRELFADGAEEAEVANVLARQARRGLLAQYILYDAEDLLRFETLIARGVIPAEGASQLFVLGRYASGQQAEPTDLIPLLNARSNRLPWMTCAFGARESAAALATASFGGHVRIGFENNVHMPDGEIAYDNAALVANVASALGAAGKCPATPDQARLLLQTR